MGAGEEPVKQTSRASLRLLGSVGEPINPEAWEWYHRVVGDQALSDRRHVVADRNRRNSDRAASRRHGLEAGLGDPAVFRGQTGSGGRSGTVLDGACEGNLVIADSWPGQMRTVYGDHERFMQTYFATYPGKYFTGDGCRAMPTAITGSPAASMTSSTYPATGWGRPR